METSRIGTFEAKTRLSELLDEVDQGRTFVITRRGQPVAELRPIPSTTAPRLTFGCDKGQVLVGEDFDEPAPDMAGYTE